MITYAVCEIAGKQVIVIPGKEIKVPFLGEVTETECSKVLLIAEKDKVSLGTPFLKEKLKFKVLGDSTGKKIRSSFYKPKGNHRKVTGIRPKYSRIELV